MSTQNRRNRRRMKRIILTAALVAVLLGLAIGIGVILGNRARSSGSKSAETEQSLSVSSDSSTKSAVAAGTGSIDTKSASVSTDSKSAVMAASSSEQPDAQPSDQSTQPSDRSEETSEQQTENQSQTEQAEQTEPAQTVSLEDEVIYWNPDWDYASYSIIHDSGVTLYRAKGENRRNIVVGINAGHGTSGGESVSTQCHPDGTPKVTGGSTAEGATYAMAVAGGTTLLDGTPEYVVTLQVAQLTRDKLLEAGFDVLMIRDSEDTQLDNIARTVFCNNNAQCHVAIHYDSTDWDKGEYYMSVPNVDSYRSMEPVASHWQEHNRLGECLLDGAEQAGVKVWESRSLETDLTQTSYSTVPSVDVEVGDRASDHSEETLNSIAEGLTLGITEFFSAS